jgi:hypothetical protein
LYAAKLDEEKEYHIKNVEKANIDAKTISQLINKEGGKTFFEQQENSKHLVKKNGQLNTSLKEIEQRELVGRCTELSSNIEGRNNQDG